MPPSRSFTQLEDLTVGTPETSGYAARPRTLARKIASTLTELTSGAWGVLDFLLAASCIAISYFLAAQHGVLEPTALPIQIAVPIFGATFVLAAHILGLHDQTIRRTEFSLIFKSVLATLLAIGISYIGTKHLFYQRIPVRPLLLAGFSLLSLLLLTRAWIWHIGFVHAERLCLIGRMTNLKAAKDFILKQPRPVTVTTLTNDQLAGVGSSFVTWAKTQYLDEVLLVDPVSESQATVLLHCMEKGIRVTSYQDHLERHYNCVSLPHIDTSWFLRTDMEALHPQYVALKRATDVFLASLGLLLASPFLLLAMLAIKLESRGPIFYGQIRTGLRGEDFRILKLRTMRTDAEANGAQWAAKRDSRITRIGKILRLTRLDELPQFINILRGDMSFIGPRPERPEFVDQLAAEIPFYKQRHLLKPGLTGWAQISADYGGSVEGAREKLQYDLYYVKYASLRLDLHICIRTIGAIMKGAR